jgi:hypothetical protein
VTTPIRTETQSKNKILKRTSTHNKHQPITSSKTKPKTNMRTHKFFNTTLPIYRPCSIHALQFKATQDSQGIVKNRKKLRQAPYKKSSGKSGTSL